LTTRDQIFSLITHGHLFMAVQLTWYFESSTDWYSFVWWDW